MWQGTLALTSKGSCGPGRTVIGGHHGWVRGSLDRLEWLQAVASDLWSSARVEKGIILVFPVQLRLAHREELGGLSWSGHLKMAEMVLS